MTPARSIRSIVLSQGVIGKSLLLLPEMTAGDSSRRRANGSITAPIVLLSLQRGEMSKQKRVELLRAIKGVFVKIGFLEEVESGKTKVTDEQVHRIKDNSETERRKRII